MTEFAVSRSQRGTKWNSGLGFSDFDASFSAVHVGGWQDGSQYQIPEVNTTLKCVCVFAKGSSNKRLALLAWQPYRWGPSPLSSSKLPYVRATERKQPSSMPPGFVRTASAHRHCEKPGSAVGF